MPDMRQVRRMIAKIAIAALLILALFGAGLATGWQWCRAKHAGIDTAQLREDGEQVEAIRKEDVRERIKIVERIKHVKVDDCWTRPVPAGAADLLRRQ
jgi:hypothetical protein